MKALLSIIAVTLISSFFGGFIIALCWFAHDINFWPFWMVAIPGSVAIALCGYCLAHSVLEDIWKKPKAQEG